MRFQRRMAKRVATRRGRRFPVCSRASCSATKGARSPRRSAKKMAGAAVATRPGGDAKEHAGASCLPGLPTADLESAALDELRVILRANGVERPAPELHPEPVDPKMEALA